MASSEELLRKLEERLILGEISEETYREVKARIEERSATSEGPDDNDRRETVQPELICSVSGEPIGDRSYFICRECDGACLVEYRVEHPDGLVLPLCRLCGGSLISKLRDRHRPESDSTARPDEELTGVAEDIEQSAGSEPQSDRGPDHDRIDTVMDDSSPEGTTGSASEEEPPSQPPPTAVVDLSSVQRRVGVRGGADAQADALPLGGLGARSLVRLGDALDECARAGDSSVQSVREHYLTRFRWQVGVRDAS